MRPIDGDAVLFLLVNEEKFYRDVGANDRADGIHDAIFDIESAPTVEAGWGDGAWVMDSNYPDRLICSECGAQFDTWHWESKQMNFCPISQR